MYFILSVNSLALAYTHFGIAPNYLTIYIAGFLSIACLIRALKWHQYKSLIFTVAQAKHQITMTIIFSIIMGIGFSVWSFALYDYGDIGLRVHIAYYMSVTVIGVIVCLIHLPAAVWSTTLTVGIPFIVFFASSGEPVFVAISINFAMVAGVLVLIALSYYRAFSSVVKAKQDLQVQHQQTKELNVKNEVLANQDSLTKLANRRSFANYISSKLNADTGCDPFVVGLIDLDGFKPVNDIHGHGAGDWVLQEVSQRLSNLLNKNCMIARIGGDEFALTISNMANHADINSIGKQISEVLKQPFEMRNGVVQISGSCGFAVYPEAGTTVDELMERADFALYRAKTKARGSCIIFTGDHETLIKHKSQIELALSQSIVNDELSLHYQPIVDGSTGQIRGLEALARWHNPILGDVSPSEFIPIAEHNGMISQITIALFNKAVIDLLTWPTSLYLSFNLSVHDINSDQTLSALKEILHKHNVASNRIQFEITETTIMNDLQRCASTTRELKDSGFLIALDDFGSGYSSLSYIHKLAFDTLKIDRSFVSNLLEDTRSQGVVKTILELSSSFNVDCIVEGVETEAQRVMLLSLGCSKMQGFLFYRPAPIAKYDLENLLRNNTSNMQ